MKPCGSRRRRPRRPFLSGRAEAAASADPPPRDCGFWTAAHLPIFAVLRLGQWGVQQNLPGDWCGASLVSSCAGTGRTMRRKPSAPLVDWLPRAYRQPKIFLDAGSSVAPYSAIALFAEPALEALCVRPVLRAWALRRCSAATAPGARLRGVHGFLADVPGPGETLPPRCSARRRRWTRRRARRICLDVLPGAGRGGRRKSPSARSTSPTTGRGAELRAAPSRSRSTWKAGNSTSCAARRSCCAMRGRSCRCSACIPTCCRSWAATTEVEDFLRGVGYRWTVVGVDHENIGGARRRP